PTIRRAEHSLASVVPRREADNVSARPVRHTAVGDRSRGAVVWERGVKHPQTRRLVVRGPRKAIGGYRLTRARDDLPVESRRSRSECTGAASEREDAASIIRVMADVDGCRLAGSIPEAVARVLEQRGRSRAARKHA